MAGSVHSVETTSFCRKMSCSLKKAGWTMKHMASFIISISAQVQQMNSSTANCKDQSIIFRNILERLPLLISGLPVDLPLEGLKSRGKLAIALDLQSTHVAQSCSTGSRLQMLRIQGVPPGYLKGQPMTHA